jgi:hypothetical protein
MVLVRQQRSDGIEILGRANLAVPCRAGLAEPWWQVESMDPLTISPSIHVEMPGVGEFHGFIRDGKWVPA